MVSLGQYKKLSLSSLWKHEAHNFTPWLYDNLNLLSDVIGLTIQKPDKEVNTGNFYVDIVAVAGENEDKAVVIENQYGNSNHDHLGKLITYAASQDASFAIWIVESAREEHIQAINMLNRSNIACCFFLLEADVFQIDESKPVIQFRKVAEPQSIDPEIPSASISKVYDWWQLFVKRAKEKQVSRFANLTPAKQHWLSCGAGRYGAYYEISISKTNVTLKLGLSKYGDKEFGNRCFDILYPHRVEIEELFGDTLQWDRMTDKKHSRISKTYDGGYDCEDWLPLMDKILSEFIKFEKAFSSFLTQL